MHPTPSDAPKRLVLVSDHLRIPYANGSSFASQWLVRALGARGTDVTVVGPDAPLATAADYPPRYVAMPSLPFRAVPGVHLALPSKTALREIARSQPEAVIAQAATALLDVGVWLREQHGVPMLSVNTLHLPSAYNAALPPFLDRRATVRLALEKTVIAFGEAQRVGLVLGLDNGGAGKACLDHGYHATANHGVVVHAEARECGIGVEIGLLTPPFGISVYVIKSTLQDADISLSDIFIGAAPFALMMLVCLAAVVLFPSIATGLLGR